MMKQFSLVLGTLILLGSMTVHYLPRPVSAQSKGEHLARVIPVNVTGWQTRTLSLGETETDRGVVEQTLKFDDVFYREYRNARGVVTVYVAYWGPTKMPTQLVASHTPDRCWSSAGWVCQKVMHRATLVGPVELRPGEGRLFRAPTGNLMQVHYWHIVGRDLYDYGERFNRVPSAWLWLRDAARQVLQSPPEQYFIRVASERPFAELYGDPGWAELLAGLARLGLAVQSVDTVR